MEDGVILVHESHHTIEVLEIFSILLVVHIQNVQQYFTFAVLCVNVAQHSLQGLILSLVKVDLNHQRIQGLYQSPYSPEFGFLCHEL